MSTDPTAIKLCTTCANPIPRGAKKCMKCGSFQDWRQYVATSSTNLALVTALLSVLTVAGPTAYTLLQPDNSRLLPSFQGFQGSAVVVLVANNGRRPGSIGHARIRFHDIIGQVGVDQIIPLLGDKNYGIVEPGTVKPIVFESPTLTPEVEKFYNDKMLPYYHGPNDDKCSFIFELRDFQQRVAERVQQVSCSAALYFLLHRLPPAVTEV